MPTREIVIWDALWETMVAPVDLLFNKELGLLMMETTLPEEAKEPERTSSVPVTAVFGAVAFVVGLWPWTPSVPATVVVAPPPPVAPPPVPPAVPLGQPIGE